MNPLIIHIANGQIFFSGIAMLILSTAIGARSGAARRRLALLLFIVATIAVAISSTSMTWPVTVVFGSVWCFYLIGLKLDRWPRLRTTLFVVTCLVAVATEIPFHIVPTLQQAPHRSLMIVGDSVTAGMGSNDTSVKWPELLATKHNLIVDDRSHVGQRAKTALKRAMERPISAEVVFIEIGGNDLLGGTGAVQFRADLDRLLAHVTTSGRQVVMLELPLPPFYHAFGHVQRDLARKYNVALIPKRVFLAILSPSESTVDSVHLTQHGHQKMAETVWDLLRSAYDDRETKPSP